MKNVEKVENAIEPIYEQFERLGELWEDENLSYNFLKQARRIFGKQYKYELKLLIKEENRNLRHRFKVSKKKDVVRFRREKKALKAKEEQRRIELRKKAKKPL